MSEGDIDRVRKTRAFHVVPRLGFRSHENQLAILTEAPFKGGPYPSHMARDGFTIPIAWVEVGGEADESSDELYGGSFEEGVSDDSDSGTPRLSTYPSTPE